MSPLASNPGLSPAALPPSVQLRSLGPLLRVNHHALPVSRLIAVAVGHLILAGSSFSALTCDNIDVFSSTKRYNWRLPPRPSGRRHMFSPTLLGAFVSHHEASE